MRIGHALKVPLDMAALLLLLIIALVFTVLSSSNSLLVILPVIMLLSYLFKYGFAVLEHVAHGEPGAPVFSHELLGPFDSRPWVQAAVCAAGFIAVRYLDDPWDNVLAVAECLVLPAWVAVLGTADRLYQAFDPLRLWRILRGLGPYYLVVLLLIGAVCAIFEFARIASLWLIVRYTLMGYCVLACYSVLGEAIYARRLELGFAARSSPERKQDRDIQERNKLRQKAIDEVYEAVNARQSANAAARLEAWLASVEDADVGPDARAIAEAAVLWRNEAGTTTVLQILIRWLLGRSRAIDAMEVARAAFARLPRFSLSSEPAALALAEAAKSLGQPRLAFTSLENFSARYPQIALSARAVTLRAECSP